MAVAVYFVQIIGVIFFQSKGIEYSCVDILQFIFVQVNVEVFLFKLKR